MQNACARVPCFRGSFAKSHYLQKHRESMWTCPEQQMASSIVKLACFRGDIALILNLHMSRESMAPKIAAILNAVRVLVIKHMAGDGSRHGEYPDMRLEL
jgi:hypothetical protein